MTMDWKDEFLRLSAEAKGDEVPVAMIWEKCGDSTYLRAVDISVNRVEDHLVALRDEARLERRPFIVRVEVNLTNHLFAHSCFQRLR
jgi:hypothetical protein